MLIFFKKKKTGKSVEKALIIKEREIIYVYFFKKNTGIDIHERVLSFSLVSLLIKVKHVNFFFA